MGLVRLHDSSRVWLSMLGMTLRNPWFESDNVMPDTDSSVATGITSGRWVAV